MAVETKVGLLVGLAFIVCFGVILSHRGTGDRISADVALELLNRHRQPAPSKASMAGTSFLRPASRSSPTISALPDRSTGGGLDFRHRRGDSGHQTSPMGEQEDRLTQGDARQRSEFTQNAPASQPPSAESTIGKKLTYESLFGGDDQNEAPKRSQPSQSAPKPQGIELLHRPEHPAAQKEPAKNVYVVQSGDTLWRIANKVYGGASQVTVDAIYNANRDALPSPNMVEVGVRLTLPALGTESTSKFTSALEAPPTETRERIEQPVTHYQVQSGDRYTLIAEKLLGDKSRWKELYELNKDIFPDAGRFDPASAFASRRRRSP